MSAAYIVDVSYMIYLSPDEVDFEPTSNDEYVYKSLQEAKKVALKYDLHQHKQGLVDRLKTTKGRVSADVITIKDGDVEDSLMMKSLECMLDNGIPVWTEK